MVNKPFRIEVEYVRLKVSKNVDELEDLVKMTLTLNPFAKIDTRDLTPSASIHTTVTVCEHTQDSKCSPFSKTIDGGNETILLVRVVGKRWMASNHRQW